LRPSRMRAPTRRGGEAPCRAGFAARAAGAGGRFRWAIWSARTARTHGPFTAEAVAERFGWGPAVAIRDARTTHRRRARGAGRLHHRPRSLLRILRCEVLRALRRKALARLRREVEPVEPSALGRFLPAWQGVGRRRRGPRRCSRPSPNSRLPASGLGPRERILPARVEGFRPWDLDALCASGEVTWAGIETLGPGDGRIALYLAENEPLLAIDPVPCEGKVHAKVRRFPDPPRRGLFQGHRARVGGFPARSKNPLANGLGRRSDQRHPGTLAKLCKMHALRSPAAAAPSVGPPAPKAAWSLRFPRLLPPGGDPGAPAKRIALARPCSNDTEWSRAKRCRPSASRGLFCRLRGFQAMEESGRFVADTSSRGKARCNSRYPAPTNGCAASGPPRTHRAHHPRRDRPEQPLRAPSCRGPRAQKIARGPRRIAGAYVIIHDGQLVATSGAAPMHFSIFPAHEPARGTAERALQKRSGVWSTRDSARCFFITHHRSAPPPTPTDGERLHQRGFALHRPRFNAHAELSRSTGEEGNPLMIENRYTSERAPPGGYAEAFHPTK